MLDVANPRNHLGELRRLEGDPIIQAAAGLRQREVLLHCPGPERDGGRRDEHRIEGMIGDADRYPHDGRKVPDHPQIVVLFGRGVGCDAVHDRGVRVPRDTDCALDVGQLRYAGR